MQAGEATLTGAGDHVFQLGGEGRPIDVTLEGLQINGMPMAFGPGGLPPAQPELASEEATAFEGEGYLAQIDNAQIGTPGDDVLIGTDGNDYISGGDGDDVIDGGAGDDTLHGDAGDDTIDGGPGHDNVYGDAGDDTLDGGDGSDLVHGGTGDDTLQGGDSADWGFDNLYGGFGADTYVVNHLSDVPDESWVTDNAVDDFRVASSFIDDFTGTKPYFTAADSFAQLPGDVAAGDHVHVSLGIENILVEGDWEADIYGGGGDNLLVGNAGANTIKGFAGDDTLDGRGGTNRLEGGLGDDTYLIDTTLDGVDTIVDADGPDALTANTLRFKGVDRADLAIARDGDTVTFHTDDVLRARIEGYDAQGPVFHVETDDARFDLLGVNHAPRLDSENFDSKLSIRDEHTGDVEPRPFPVWSPSVDEPALDFEGDLFVDVDHEDEAQVEASLFGGAELPDWLTFDDHANRFEASPPSEAAGRYVVEMTATDTQGLSADTSFVLDVGGTSPDAYDIAEGTTRTFRPPWDRFSDIDLTSVERVAVNRADGTALPEWISFDAATGRVTAAPGNGDAGEVAVRFTATDDTGVTESVDLAIVAEHTNNAPTASVASTLRPATEDKPFSWTLPDDLFHDVDADDTLRIDVGTLPHWLSYDSDAERFHGTPENADVGTHDVVIGAVDDAGARAETALTIDVANVNDAPMVGEVPEGIQYLRSEELTPQGPYSYRLPAELFSDPDRHDTLDLTARRPGGEALPPDISFDESTGIFTTERPNGDRDPFEVEVVATDSYGARAYATLSLDVSVFGNRPPIVDASETAHEAGAFEEQAFTWQPETEWFTEEDGDPLHFEATLGGGGALPEWLDVDPASGAITGTPDASDAGEVAIELWAVDSFGARSSVYEQVEQADGSREREAVPTPVRLDLDVRENTAPEWTDGAFDDHTVTEDAGAVTIEVPDDAVVDADGDPLVLSAQRADGRELPDWLSFDPVQRQFVALPTTGDPADGPTTVTVEVTAREDRAGGETASTRFDLTVEPVNDAPDLVEPSVDMKAGFEGRDYSWQVPHRVFVDEEGDRLSYQARLASSDYSENLQPDGDPAELPSWLHFDADTGTFLADAPAPTAGDGHRETVEYVTDDVPTRWAHYDLEVTADDGETTSAEALELTFKVKKENDAPVVDGHLENIEIAQDERLEIVVPNDLFRDPDGDDLTVEATLANGRPLPDWLDFENGVFTGTPGQADVGQVNVALTAEDPAGAEASASFAVTVADVNDAPTVEKPYVDRAVEEGETLELDKHTHFSDPDTGDRFDVEARLDGGDPLPAWLELDREAGTLRVVPSAEAAEFGHQEDNTVVVELRAVDADDLASEWTSWELDIVPLPDLVNGPEDEMLPDGTPILADERLAGTVRAFEDKPFVDFTVPGRWTTASDADLSASLDADDSNLADPDNPFWLAFDPVTGTFEQKRAPDDADVGKDQIELVATDGAGHEDVESFELVVEEANDPPELDDDAPADFEQDLAAAGARQGEAWSVVPPDDLFTDPEDDRVDIRVDRESLADTGWVRLDPATGKLYGTPENAHVGEVTLRFRGEEIGTDDAFVTDWWSVTFQVANANDAPVVRDGAAVDDRAIALGEPFAALDAAALFDDPDLEHGDRLDYVATTDGAEGLPEGLSLTDGELIGTPTEAGAYDIALAARDADGAESSPVTFRLDVAEPDLAEDPLVLGSDGLIDAAAFADNSFNTSYGNSSSKYLYYDREINGNKLLDLSDLEDFVGKLYPVESSLNFELQDYTGSQSPGPKAVVMGDADNIILGNSVTNVIYGGAGDDTLYGAGGDDALYGGAGDDVLVSGTGSNELHGGEGDDRYEIGGRGEAGLREGDLDTIVDDHGANIVDFDGVPAEQMSFGMDGADLVIAVDGADAVGVRDFATSEASFDLELDDGGVANAALLAAVEEMRATFENDDRTPLDDVLADYTEEAHATADALAAFLPDGNDPDAAASTQTVAATDGLEEPAGTFVTPNGMTATTEAAAAGLATKPALEEEPAYG
ncbi:MAG: putative Ig domain-containing protein [Alphaproteobacteria bacterium]